jgi:hypothetical protein
MLGGHHPTVCRFLWERRRIGHGSGSVGELTLFL